jgi:hypothetical protein
MGAAGSVNTSLAMSPHRLSSQLGSSAHSSGRGIPIFEVSFHSAENFKFATELPPKFLLRISYESLDFVNMETLSPIIQCEYLFASVRILLLTLVHMFVVPFQHIICWGSGPTNFRFHLFDFERKESASNNNSNGRGSESKRDSNGGDQEEDANDNNKDISIVLRTNEGSTIEDNIMRIVRMLMVDMEKKAVSKDEFNVLITTIYNIDSGELRVCLNLRMVFVNC